ncbi:hypothetical protein [Sandaracinus amylolyticus]|uniref:hypothetical protein n=1 Tax=Sandaracinus amylolyticus TaxID=927083 RepID=UPI0012ED6E4C|nr:hypothetical protein [Sandaracinus amylolyticus]
MSDLERALLDAADAAGARGAQLEASVRGGAGVAISGARMMIERASPAIVEAIWRTIALAPAPDVDALIRAARDARVPLIAGWDVAHEHAIAKLYVNASDAAPPVRAAIPASLGWPALDALPAPPHLVAINASARGVERKAYVQSAHASSDHARARWLDALASSHGAHGGVVRSWDLAEGTAHERAYFVAVRGGSRDRADALLAALPGFDDARSARALPFERGQCRSIGVDLRGDELRWTAYFKPAGAGTPLWSVEPFARFRAGDVHVAMFVAPHDHEERAYARTARHAISFRGERDAPRELVRPLLEWAVAVMRDEEDPQRALASPPPPWIRC